MDACEEVIKDKAAALAQVRLAAERYRVALRHYLTRHPKDAMLVLECGDETDFGVNLLGVAAGLTSAEVLRDLAAEAAAMWPADGGRRGEVR